jgi:hypothetical protein
MTFAIGVTVSVTIGFLAGLMTVGRASRWCPTCGVSLICPQHHPTDAVDRPAAQ